MDAKKSLTLQLALGGVLAIIFTYILCSHLEKMKEFEVRIEEAEARMVCIRSMEEQETNTKKTKEPIWAKHKW